MENLPEYLLIIDWTSFARIIKLEEIMETKKAICDTIIVCYDYTHGEDETILLVGRRNSNSQTDIINAFQGHEATELYNKLVTSTGLLKEV